jgi:hypothetical protein
MLLRILDFEGAFAIPEPGKSRPRFLIICHWPNHRMDGGDACPRLGLRIVTITAAKKPEERAAAIAEFTSPRFGCQGLITTYNCGATGLNLHNNCHIVILMEQAPNHNLETQAIGRVHRVGQRFAQRAYHLFQDHTVRRYLHHNNFKKMLPHIAAQYRDELQGLVDKDWRAQTSTLKGMAWRLSRLSISTRSVRPS